MKIIFLDVDGVLINRRVLMLKNGWDKAASECVEQLNNLLERTGAVIVVSSTWRLGREIDELQDLLIRWGVKGVKVIGKTKWLTQSIRGVEIETWLDEHKDLEIESFVILDDDRDMGRMKEYLVQTKFNLGLTAADVENAVKILNFRQEEIHLVRMYLGDTTGIIPEDHIRELLKYRHPRNVAAYIRIEMEGKHVHSVVSPGANSGSSGS